MSYPTDKDPADWTDDETNEFFGELGLFNDAADAVNDTDLTDMRDTAESVAKDHSILRGALIALMVTKKASPADVSGALNLARLLLS